MLSGPVPTVGRWIQLPDKEDIPEKSVVKYLKVLGVVLGYQQGFLSRKIG